MSTDYFFYNTGQLNILAGASTVRQGLAYFTENCAFSKDGPGEQLATQVGGSSLSRFLLIAIANRAGAPT